CSVRGCGELAPGEEPGDLGRGHDLRGVHPAAPETGATPTGRAALPRGRPGGGTRRLPADAHRPTRLDRVPGLRASLRAYVQRVPRVAGSTEAGLRRHPVVPARG